MSIRLAQQYEVIRADVIAELSEIIPAQEPALLYGSVSRAFGPFGDVDVITFGSEKTIQTDQVRGIKVQEHVFALDDFRDYMVHSPRGWHTAIDGIMIHSATTGLTEPSTLHLAQHEYIAAEGRADFVALMLAEQEGDPLRKDIQTNYSRYALKRQAGAKRSTTRSYLSATVMSEPPLMDGIPSERMEGLLESGFLKPDQLEAIYAINCLLGIMSQGYPLPMVEWQHYRAITQEWNESIAGRSQDFLAERLPRDFMRLLTCAMSDNAREQAEAVTAAKALKSDNVRARTILWRLMANQTIDADVLYNAWQLCEQQPRVLRELGCCAVQLPQFRDLDIDPASKLLNDPDVQFSLNYKATSP